jgi:hypothetical protein
LCLPRCRAAFLLADLHDPGQINQEVLTQTGWRIVGPRDAFASCPVQGKPELLS